MNILLIDNGTTLLEKLRVLIPNEEVVHTWKDFSDQDVASADVIILSGGSLFQLQGNEGEFTRELDLIRTTTKPIIGLCFGCELIITAFGGTLRELTKEHKGLRSIHLETPHLLPGTKDIQVYENHRWIVDQVPQGFKVLATSSEGPELLKHTSKPLYALQFHPENKVDVTEGDELFLSILSSLTAAA